MNQILIKGYTRGLGYSLLELYLAQGWTVYAIVRNETATTLTHHGIILEEE